MKDVFAKAFLVELEKIAAFAAKGTPKRKLQVKRMAQGIKSTRTSAVPTAVQAKSPAFAAGRKAEAGGKVYSGSGTQRAWQKFSRPITQGWTSGGVGGAAKGVWAGSKASPLFGIGTGIAGLSLLSGLRGQKQSPGSVQGMVNVPG